MQADKREISQLTRRRSRSGDLHGGLAGGNLRLSAG